ncbi:MRNIP protein, partial [Chloroceryle aenea]|nr:MRNIP protein [Chloroceryle aenea]
FFFQLYGQGSGLDCRHHVQKLNLLQGEAEEALGWTSRCVEGSVNDSRYIAAQHENSSVHQGGTEVSRWSKYLDKDNEDEVDGEDEAGTERQQFCSQRKNTVEHNRKHQKSFLSSDIQDYTEENGVFQFTCQAKKVKAAEKRLLPDPEAGDAVSGDTVVPQDNTQTPAVHTKPSKWEKFLSCSDNCGENAARATQSPQEGSRRLGLRSTTAAATGVDSRCLEEVGRTPPPGRGFQLKCTAGTEQLVSKVLGTVVPSSSCSAEEDALFKEPPNKLIRAGCGVTETTAGRCCLESTGRENALVNCNLRPKPSNSSHEHLFCTDDEFDDNL